MASPAGILGQESILKGSLILGYKRNQIAFTQKSDFDGYSRYEGTLESTDRLNLFIAYKTKPSSLFDSKILWGIEATYSSFSLNNLIATNFYDEGNRPGLGASTRITKIVNEIEFEDDVQGNFGYIMPTVAYMLGENDNYVSLGVGYGYGSVELKALSSKAKKHDVTISYEDGHTDQQSYTEYNTEYGNPFEDTGGYVATTLAFFEVRVWFFHFSIKQGSINWTAAMTAPLLKTIMQRNSSTAILVILFFILASQNQKICM